MKVPKTTMVALQTLGAEERATLFMTMLAALQTLLHRYSGLDDIIVGTPVANRHYPGVENVIGFFVNMLALRTDFSGGALPVGYGGPSFREVLRRVRRTSVEAYAHQDLPFEVLIEKLQLPRDLDRKPVFQVLLLMATGAQPDSGRELPGLEVERLHLRRETAGRDLTFSVRERGGEWLVTLNERSALFDAGFADSMLANFQTLLEGIVAGPDRPVWALPLVSPEEQQRILQDWNEQDDLGRWIGVLSSFSRNRWGGRRRRRRPRRRRSVSPTRP